MAQQFEDLVKAHIGWIVATANRLQQRECPSVGVDDLIQMGLIALWQCRERFDETKNTSFRTYARHRVRGAMQDHLREMDFVSRLGRDLNKEIVKITMSIQAKKGRRPTLQELEKALLVPKRTLRQHQLVTHRPPVSIDATQEVNPKGEIRNILSSYPHPGQSPEAQAQAIQIRRTLQRAIQSLPPERQQEVRDIFENGFTQEVLAKSKKIDWSTVTRRKTANLRKLRKALKGFHFTDFL